MPKHDQPRCRIPVAHPPHPPGVDRQARGDWRPGGPGDPAGALPVTAERAELLGLGVMVTVLERMSPDERRRSLAYLDDRFGPPRIGGWVKAACGCVWADPPALLVNPAEPRICIECSPEHPAAVGRASNGMPLMPVTYHHERPGGDA